jgi:hypothetical protein
VIASRRDSWEFELLVVFALERKLADPPMVASGLPPWLSHAREVALPWRASSRLEFMSAPGASRRMAAGGRTSVVTGRCRVGRWAFSRCGAPTTGTIRTGRRTMGIGAFGGCAEFACTALALVNSPGERDDLGLGVTSHEVSFTKVPTSTCLRFLRGEYQILPRSTTLSMVPPVYIQFSFPTWDGNEKTLNATLQAQGAAAAALLILRAAEAPWDTPCCWCRAPSRASPSG